MRGFCVLYLVQCTISFAPLPFHAKAPAEEVETHMKVQQELINGFTPEFWPPETTGTPVGSDFPAQAAHMLAGGVGWETAETQTPQIVSATELQEATRALPDVYRLSGSKPVSQFVVKPVLTEAIAVPPPLPFSSGRQSMHSRGSRVFRKRRWMEQTEQQQQQQQQQQPLPPPQQQQQQQQQTVNEQEQAVILQGGEGEGVETEEQEEAVRREKRREEEEEEDVEGVEVAEGEGEGKRKKVPTAVRVLREEIEETERGQSSIKGEGEKKMRAEQRGEDAALEREIESRLDQLLEMVEALSTKTGSIESKLGEVRTSDLEERMERLIQATEATSTKTDVLENKIDGLSSNVARLMKPSRNVPESLAPEQSPIPKPRKRKSLTEKLRVLGSQETDSVPVVLNKILRYLNGELITLPQAVKNEQSTSPQQQEHQQHQAASFPSSETQEPSSSSLSSSQPEEEQQQQQQQLGFPRQLLHPSSSYSSSSSQQLRSSADLNFLKHLVQALKKKDADLAVLSKTSSLLKIEQPAMGQSRPEPSLAAPQHTHHLSSQQRQQQQHSQHTPQMMIQRSEISKSEVSRKASRSPPLPLPSLLRNAQHLKKLNDETEEEVRREQEADLLREEKDEHNWVSQKTSL